MRGMQGSRPHRMGAILDKLVLLFSFLPLILCLLHPVPAPPNLVPPTSPSSAAPRGDCPGAPGGQQRGDVFLPKPTPPVCWVLHLPPRKRAGAGQPPLQPQVVQLPCSCQPLPPPGPPLPLSPGNTPPLGPILQVQGALGPLAPFLCLGRLVKLPFARWVMEQQEHKCVHFGATSTCLRPVQPAVSSGSHREPGGVTFTRRHGQGFPSPPAPLHPHTSPSSQILREMQPKC